MRYSWPGNIRELQNVIERCVILADGEVLRVEPGMLMQEAPPIATAPIATRSGSDRKAEIEAVLRETRGKVYGPHGAAARLGLPATTLDSQMRALMINKHQFKNPEHGTRCAHQLRGAMPQSGEHMLMITKEAENAELIRVNLCGSFTVEYVPEVETALAPKWQYSDEIRA